MPPSATCVCVIPTVSTGATRSLGDAGASVTDATGTPAPSTHSFFSNDITRAASDHASSVSYPSP